MHAAGDIFAGRYDLDTGEMRSDHINERNKWFLRIEQIIGVLLILQSAALLFDAPELLMPLRVRIGR